MATSLSHQEFIRKKKKNYPIKSIFRNITRFKYFIHNPGAYIKVYKARPQKPDDISIDISRRILESYKKMKKDIENNPKKELFLPSALWYRNICEGFSFMIEASKKNDVNSFAYFLTNVLSWRRHLGFTTGMLYHRYNMFKKYYLQNEIFSPYLYLWMYFNRFEKNIRKLEHSRIGNPDGAFIDNVFITYRSFDLEIYANILQQIVNKEKAVIADLGGGYGGLLYFISKYLKNPIIIDFDLPEIVCTAAFFHMRNNPDKKVLLYGEDSFSGNSIKEYDLIFMPSMEIKNLEDASVDLFINTNSLGEMLPKSVNEYIYHICRSTQFFFHRNHDINRRIFPDGEKGLLASEYPLPGNSSLLWRYPCFLRNIKPNNKVIDILNNDNFIYLYKSY